MLFVTKLQKTKKKAGGPQITETKHRGKKENTTPELKKLK